MFGTIPFAPKKHFQAPATAEDMGSFNLDTATQGKTTEEEALGDRGDDFDPSLFDDTDGASRKSAPKAPEEEAKADEAKSDGDKSTDEAKADDKAAEPKPEDKKPSRAERRIQQLTERAAALERQLAERVGSVETAKSLADLEARAAELDKQYHKALAEDPEKASDLMREIRKTDREIARIEAAAEAEATVNQRLEQRDLGQTINELTEKYPQLDKGGEEFDQDLTTEVNAVFQGLIPISSSKSAALRRAVQIVLGEAKPAVAGLGEPNKGDKVRDERREEGVKKTVDTVNRQPPSVSTVGTQGAKATNSTVKSIKDLDNLSEEELAKLRGDEG